MSRFDINADNKFEYGGEHFVIDMSAGPRRPSDDEAFTLVKAENYLRIYDSIADEIQPRSVLELGIYQGGSYVLLDKLFKPKRMSALDINEKPVEPLMRYISQAEDRYAHFGVSQSDVSALRRIVGHDLADELDLVIDDASHSYEHTKASFEVLFPLMQQGGIYIIEDWAWAHHPSYQSDTAPFAHRPALTTLLFEQILLQGSTNDILEVQIMKPLYIIRKSTFARVGHDDVWSGILTRGRPLNAI